MTTDAATVIAHVVEHQDINPQDLATAREGLKQEIENDKRSRFFGAYMVKARDRMKIAVDQEVLRSLVGYRSGVRARLGLKPRPCTSLRTAQ